MLWPLGSWPQWPQPQGAEGWGEVGSTGQGECPGSAALPLTAAGERSQLRALAWPRTNHRFYSCEDGINDKKKYDDLASPGACCPHRHPVGSHCTLVTGASSVGAMVLTRGWSLSLTHLTDEQCLSSQLSEAALTRPQFRGPFNLTGMLPRDLHVCTPFLGLGTAGGPVRPKRGHPRYKAPPGPGGRPAGQGSGTMMSQWL